MKDARFVKRNSEGLAQDVLRGAMKFDDALAEAKRIKKKADEYDAFMEEFRERYPHVAQRIVARVRASLHRFPHTQ